MNFPDISVLIVTYNRPQEIRETLRALREHLRYSGIVHWHVCDDGSPAGYLDNLKADFPALALCTTVTPRRGWGANVNTGLKSIPEHFTFLCEDDYVAQRPLDLNQGVALLASNTKLGLVRYDGLAGHDLMLHVEECKTGMGALTYLRLLGESKALNLYSNRPHLKHLRFHQQYGEYPMGKPLGITEESYAHKVKDRYGSGPGIACLPDGVALAFKHIGKSYQGGTEDVGKR